MDEMQNLKIPTMPFDSGKTSLNVISQPINVGYINFSWLEDISGTLENDLQQCECGAYLNSLSKINENIWKCDFCGREMHAGMMLPPMLGTTLQAKVAKKTIQPNKEISFVLCVDISESMNRTAVLRKENGKDIYYQRDGRYISVWEALVETTAKLLEQIAKEKPNAIVGLILFANKVYIHGDGGNEPFIVSDEHLYSPNSIFELASKYCQNHMKKPIIQTIENLKNILFNVKQNQFTALGPAIISSLALLKRAKPGSQVLLMTDGKANYGCGNLEELSLGIETDNFYKTMAIPAKENGIIFSVLSFGADCALDGLLPLVHGTQGIARRISLDQEYMEMRFPYANTAITDIEINILSDQLLELSAVDPTSEISLNRHALRKTYKEMNTNSAYFFEYSLVKGDIQQMAKEYVTIQIQVTYTTQMMRFKRVATEKIMLVPNMPIFSCTNYFAITRYSGEVIQYAMQQSNENQSKTLDKIKNLIKEVYSTKKNNLRFESLSQMTKRDKCLEVMSQVAKKLQKSLNNIKKSKDKLVILANTCATTCLL